MPNRLRFVGIVMFFLSCFWYASNEIWWPDQMAWWLCQFFFLDKIVANNQHHTHNILATICRTSALLFLCGEFEWLSFHPIYHPHHKFHYFSYSADVHIWYCCYCSMCCCFCFRFYWNIDWFRSSVCVCMHRGGWLVEEMK